MKITAKILNRIAGRVFFAYTKKELLAFLKEKLATDNRWAGRALERIYEGQTRSEQIQKTTQELNNRGFSGRDAEFLTSLYVWYSSHNKTMTPKQWTILKRIIPKYAGQLYRSDYFKLETLIMHYIESQKNKGL